LDKGLRAGNTLPEGIRGSSPPPYWGPHVLSPHKDTTNPPHKQVKLLTCHTVRLNIPHRRGDNWLDIKKGGGTP